MISFSRYNHDRLRKKILDGLAWNQREEMIRRDNNRYAHPSDRPGIIMVPDPWSGLNTPETRSKLFLTLRYLASFPTVDSIPERDGPWGMLSGREKQFLVAIILEQRSCDRRKAIFRYIMWVAVIIGSAMLLALIVHAFNSGESDDSNTEPDDENNQESDDDHRDDDHRDDHYHGYNSLWHSFWYGGIEFLGMPGPVLMLIIALVSFVPWAFSSSGFVKPGRIYKAWAKRVGEALWQV
jgi:hypothetical protein